ncbi:Spn31A, partial [Drosophila busckii]
LYQPIAQQNANKNIIYSPASVHAMLGMLFGVSSGQTAAELQRAGQFSNDKLAVARDFARTLGKQQQQQDNVQFILANNLYFNQELSQPNPDYQRYAKEFYNTGIEPVNMKRSTQTSNRINNWVTEATRNIIRQLVTPNDIEEQDQALLVNAMYFKARWANEFSSMDTTAEKFWLNRGSQINVPMMYNDDVFAYAELPELDATAVELPYANTQTSMLLILPNQLDGLAQLERQLANVDLNALAARLRRELVTVRLPKFRIDFEQNMVGPLQRLGVQRIFTADSEVDAMLMDRVRMSKILQKAFIDVNEAGSEAAAASCKLSALVNAKFVPLSLPVKSRVFTANHPFFFAIRTPESVLFIGHVVEP